MELESWKPEELRNYFSVRPSMGSEVFAAGATEGWNMGTIQSLIDFDRQAQDEDRIDPGERARREALGVESKRRVSKDEWQKSDDWRPGIDYTDYMTPERARTLATYHDQREVRQQIIANRQSLTPLIAGFIAGSVPDPTNFIPFVAPVRGARFATNVGRVALDATLGAAVASPIIKLGANARQEDYGASDMAMDIAGSAAFGALFGTIPAALMRGEGRALGDASGLDRGAHVSRLTGADARIQEAIVRKAVSDIMGGEPVDVSAILARYTPTTETAVGRVGIPGEPFALSSPTGYRVNELPNVGRADFANLGDVAAMRARTEQIDAALAKLPASNDAKALAAEDSLTRLEEVTRRLGDETVTGDARRALMTRRDELLTDTNPETLRASAAPLQERRALEAERDSIGGRMAQHGERQADEAVTAMFAQAKAGVFPLKLAEKVAAIKAMPNALQIFATKTAPRDFDISKAGDLLRAGETLGRSRIYDANAAGVDALKGDMPELDDLADLERIGRLSDEDKTTLKGLDENITRAESRATAIKQAALCLMGN